MADSRLVPVKYSYKDLLFIQLSVNEHQGTAAQVRAKCTPTAHNCSAKQADSRLVPVKYTYEDLLFTQLSVTEYQGTAAQVGQNAPLLLSKTG